MRIPPIRTLWGYFAALAAVIAVTVGLWSNIDKIVSAIYPPTPPNPTILSIDLSSDSVAYSDVRSWSVPSREWLELRLA